MAEHNPFIDPEKVGTPYTSEEDDMILDGGYELINVALLTGRSLDSIKKRKNRLVYLQNFVKKKEEEIREAEARALAEKEQQYREAQERNEGKVSTDDRKGEPYTPEEDEVVMNPELSYKEIAKQINRTTQSVKSRKQRLRDLTRGVDVRARKREQYRNGGKETKRKWDIENKEHVREYGAAYDNFNRDAENSRKAFTPEDDVTVLRTDITSREKAVLINRSMASIKGRLRKLRAPGAIQYYHEKYGGFNADAKNHGLYTPEEDLVIADDTLNIKEKCLKLDRTMNSVRARIRKFQKKQKKELELEKDKELIRERLNELEGGNG